MGHTGEMIICQRDVHYYTSLSKAAILVITCKFGEQFLGMESLAGGSECSFTCKDCR